MESTNKVSSTLISFHFLISIRLGGLLSKLIRNTIRYLPINIIDNINNKFTNINPLIRPC